MGLGEGKNKQAFAGECWVPVGAGLCVAALFGLAALQYAMPAGFDNLFGVSHPGVRHYQDQLLGGRAPRIGLPAFVLAFRFLTVLAWLGYALALAGTLRRTGTPFRRLVALVTGVSVLMALGCPPSLSTDVYAYAGWARLPVLYGLNPYVTPPRMLQELGDATSHFLTWNIPFNYGSLWMLLSMGIVAALQGAGLWWEIAAMKLLEAAALLGAALAGRAIANRFRTGTGEAAFVAIGLNPLLQIEGPGNAHNDLLMISLLLGAAAFLPQRAVVGALCLGVSLGIKLVTAVAVPWVLIEQWRGRPLPRALAGAAGLGTLIVLPLAVGYAPLWKGADTFTGLRVYAELRRIKGEQYERGADTGAPGERGGAAAPQTTSTSLLARQWPVLVAYLLVTLWLWRCGRPLDWLAAWAVLSTGLVFWRSGFWFPWYFIWPYAPLMTRWDRIHLRWNAAALGIAASLTMLYSVPA